MSEPLNYNAGPVRTPLTLSESELAKLKDLLKTLGHDVEAVWDTAVALVKKAK